LDTSLRIVVLPAAVPTNPGQSVTGSVQTVRMLYVVDAADDAPNDKVLKFADTLGGVTGNTRVIHVSTPPGVSIRATTTSSSGGDSFEDGTTRTGQGYEIRYHAAPLPSGDPRTTLGKLELILNTQATGTNPIQLRARTTPPHVLNISMDQLE